MAQILLIENRPEQSIAYQLNLNIYLGANVRLVEGWRLAAAELERSADWDLIVSRARVGEEDAIGPLTAALAQRGLRIPLLPLPEPLDIKALLSQAAKILGITAESMARLKVPDWFPIPTVFFGYLISFPCDVYDQKSVRGPNPPESPLFAADVVVDPRRIAELTEDETCLYIRSSMRLRFANALTGQMASASRQLNDDRLGTPEKMTLLNASLNTLAVQFQKAGVDPKTVELAKSCILGMETVAKAFPTAAGLVEKLLQDKASYRYAHSQLITFVSLHLENIMGRSVEDATRPDFAQAAFFHDLVLESDREAKVASEAALAAGNFPEASRERILGHAGAAAALVEKGLPDARAETRQVVREHHGRADGRGFSASLEGLGEDTKTFVLAEKYADFLLEAAAAGRAPDKRGLFQALRAAHADPEALQLIEGLRYLDPGLFMQDLSDTAQAADRFRADEKVARDVEALAGLNALARRQWQAIRFYGEKFSEILRLVGEGKAGPGGPGPEEVRILQGAVKTIDDCTVRVKGALGEDPGDAKTVVKGVTDEILSTSVSVQGTASALETGNERMKVESLNRLSDYMIAAKTGDLPRLQELLSHPERKALKIRDSEGRTALHYAAMGGNVVIVDLLMQEGLSIRDADAQRRSPLYYAILLGRDDVAGFLIQKGANVNQQTLKGFNLVMLAAFRGNLGLLKQLHAAGARLTSRDYEGKTVYSYAEAARNPEVSAFLKTLQKEKS